MRMHNTIKMNYIKVSGYVRIRTINVILPGFKGYGEKGYNGDT